MVYFCANKAQLQMKQQQRSNKFSNLYGEARNEHFPGMKQQSIFLGLFFH